MTTPLEQNPQHQHIRVGVGVLVLSPVDHPKSVLVGIRKGSHGAGQLALPGGHMEKYEGWEDTAVREIKEETDLDLDPSTVQFVGLTNDPMPDIGRHYVTIFVAARLKADSKPLANLEPQKCEGWIWETWESLKEKSITDCFLPLQHALTSPTFDAWWAQQ